MQQRRHSHYSNRSPTYYNHHVSARDGAIPYGMLFLFIISSSNARAELTAAAVFLLSLNSVSTASCSLSLAATTWRRPGGWTSGRSPRRHRCLMHRKLASRSMPPTISPSPMTPDLSTMRHRDAYRANSDAIYRKHDKAAEVIGGLMTRQHAKR